MACIELLSKTYSSFILRIPVWLFLSQTKYNRRLRDLAEGEIQVDVLYACSTSVPRRCWVTCGSQRLLRGTAWTVRAVWTRWCRRMTSVAVRSRTHLAARRRTRATLSLAVKAHKHTLSADFRQVACCNDDHAWLWANYELPSTLLAYLTATNFITLALAAL